MTGIPLNTLCLIVALDDAGCLAPLSAAACNGKIVVTMSLARHYPQAVGCTGYEVRAHWLEALVGRNRTTVIAARHLLPIAKLPEAPTQRRKREHA